MSQTFFIGKVTSVCDEYNGNRVRVKIPIDGNKEPEDGWPYAFPLLPKTLQSIPKKGEMVFVFLINPEKRNSSRFYVGPIISQPQKMYMDKATINDAPINLTPQSTASPLETTNHFSETFGSFPSTEEVALIGRKSEDIILKDDEINIRCGVRNEVNGEDNKSLVGNILFNSESPTYIQLKHRRNGQRGKQNLINLVGGKINLMSNSDASKITNYMRNYNNVETCKDEMWLNRMKGMEYDDKIIQQEGTFKEPEYNELISTLHQLPYGDILVKILKIIQQAILTHEHPWAQQPPTFEGVPEMIQLKTWGQGSDPNNAPNLDELLLSDTVRIS